MDSQKFDVILPQELENFGYAPIGWAWCTMCEAFEDVRDGGQYVPANEAPISYDFWIDLHGKYMVTKCYAAWIRDGKPLI